MRGRFRCNTDEEEMCRMHDTKIEPCVPQRIFYALNAILNAFRKRTEQKKTH